MVRVFPQALAERIQFMGITGEVWMQPGVTRADVRAHQALAGQDRNRPGQVTLILGAGNAAFLSPEDVLYQLFVADHVVILKPTPVNAYLGSLLGEVMQPLVQRGYLRIVHGGAAEGAYLNAHPAVDAIHLTGCDRTFEDIVFGSGPDGQRRKAERRPLLTKPISAELGNVTPIIVVPGPWRAHDIREQALHLATWLVLNAGCNCISERVIVQHQDWPQREVLLAALSEVLARVPTHRACYPGAAERHRYGTISINHWLGYAYYFGLSPWGGYPGSDVYNVQSGIGMANNALMLEDTRKTVYRAPFHKLIDPYTVQSKRIAEFGRKLAAYDGIGALATFAGLLGRRYAASQCR